LRKLRTILRSCVHFCEYSNFPASEIPTLIELSCSPIATVAGIRTEPHKRTCTIFGDDWKPYANGKNEHLQDFQSPLYFWEQFGTHFRSQTPENYKENDETRMLKLLKKQKTVNESGG